MLRTHQKENPITDAKKEDIQNSETIVEELTKEVENEEENGTYKVNDKIPSESELCKIYGTSRITVRKALDELVTRGLLYRKHGVGTFIRERVTEIHESDAKKILLVLPNYPELFSAGIISSMLSGIHKEVTESGYMMVTLMEPRNEQDSVQFIRDIKAIKPDRHA